MQQRIAEDWYRYTTVKTLKVTTLVVNTTHCLAHGHPTFYGKGPQNLLWACLLPTCKNAVRSESRRALRLRYVDLVVDIEVAVEVCCCLTFHCIHLTSRSAVFVNKIKRVQARIDAQGHHFQHLL